MKKRILLFGHFNVGALTDDIIRLCTVQQIRRIIPDAEVENLNAVEQAKKYQHIDGQSLAEFINENYDLVIIDGGTSWGKIRMTRLVDLSKALDFLKVPMVFYGVGWRKEEEKISREEKRGLKKLLEYASAFGVRGNLTKTEFKKYKLNDKSVEVIGDPVLDFTPRDTGDPFKNLAKPVLGMNLREMSRVEIEQDKRTPDNAFTLDLFTRIADAWIETTGGSVVIYPFTLPNVLFSDGAAANRLKENSKHPEDIQIRYMNMDIMASEIGNLDFFVGQRFHTNLLALVNNTPFIPVENQYEKLADLLSLGFPFEVTEIKELTPQKVFDAYHFFDGTVWDKVNAVIAEFKITQAQFLERALA